MKDVIDLDELEDLAGELELKVSEFGDYAEQRDKVELLRVFGEIQSIMENVTKALGEDK